MPRRLSTSVSPGEPHIQFKRISLVSMETVRILDMLPPLEVIDN